ncbi:MAG: hypothetical protein CMJ58_01880 [Planctomycetaceae bacterium]|nr:hypothetical protein [Planctomycetaceae bacterium]
MTPGSGGDPKQRLAQLIEVVLDGSCTDAQRMEFSQSLDAHPELIRAVVREVFVHNLLACEGDDAQAERSLTDEWDAGLSCDLDCAAAEPVPGDLVSRTERTPVAAGAGWRGWQLAAAAVVLLAAGALLTKWAHGPAESEPPIAQIVQSEDVIWSEGTTARRGDGDIGPGRLEMRAGQLVLQFDSGARLRFDGAASLMIESDRVVHLDAGQATARVPAGQQEFTIKTPAVDVVDQGTEFGVAARDDGRTDVVVFGGEVQLRDRFSRQQAPTRLAQGEGARVDRQGDLTRIMQVSINTTGAWWTFDSPVRGTSVIKEVRDNIPPDDGSKYFCYQIAYRSFQEDAFAYADHRHQYNGITKAGLPSMLVGADYVKTFNDYRYLNDLEMEVRLERPANLYVMFDDRVPPPEWLTSQFEDTGVDVGLDEGPWPWGDKALRPDLPPFENGVGPGVSIDNSFSVWHRVCRTTEPVRLGAVGPTKEARAMYGIAATPLDDKWLASGGHTPTFLRGRVCAARAMTQPSRCSRPIVPRSRALSLPIAECTF